MENTYCVYMHINKINGKKYVGMTKHGDNPNKRWKNGRSYVDYELFWPDIQKYGWDNFHHLVIENNLSYKEAKEKEERYILTTESNNEKYGYNIIVGSKPQEKTKLKISKANKGKKRSEIVKRKFSESRKGEKNPCYGKNPFKNKTKEEMEIIKIKKIASRNGKKHSEEHKRKLSEAAIRKFVNNSELKEKLSEINKGGKNPAAKKCLIIYKGVEYETESKVEIVTLFKNKFNINVYNWITNGKIQDKYIGDVQLIKKNEQIIYKKEEGN